MKPIDKVGVGPSDTSTPPLASNSRRTPTRASSLSPQPRQEPNEPVLTKLASVLKSYCTTDDSPQQVHKYVMRHLQTLRLIDESNNWQITDEQLQKDLAIEALDQTKITGFIDEIQKQNSRNECLMDSLASIAEVMDEGSVNQLKEKTKQIGHEIIAFAFVLNAITKRMHRDTEFSIECIQHWLNKAKEVGLQQTMPYAFRIKFESILAPIRRFHELIAGQEEIPPDFANWFLPLNILEATIYDAWYHHWDNAAAGWELAKHQPGNNPDPHTGQGPTKRSADGKVIETGLPFAKKWADLYVSWNICFGADFDNLFFFANALLIPEVANYQNNPQEFLWNRVNALMAYLFFGQFSEYDATHQNPENELRVDETSYGKESSKFFRMATEAVRKWGEINNRYSKEFANALVKAKATPVEIPNEP